MYNLYIHGKESLGTLINGVKRRIHRDITQRKGLKTKNGLNTSLGCHAIQENTKKR